MIECNILKDFNKMVSDSQRMVESCQIEIRGNERAKGKNVLVIDAPLAELFKKKLIEIEQDYKRFAAQQKTTREKKDNCGNFYFNQQPPVELKRGEEVVDKTWIDKEYLDSYSPVDENYYFPLGRD